MSSSTTLLHPTAPRDTMSPFVPHVHTHIHIHNSYIHIHINIYIHMRKKISHVNTHQSTQLHPSTHTQSHITTHATHKDIHVCATIVLILLLPFPSSLILLGVIANCWFVLQKYMFLYYIYHHIYIIKLDGNFQWKSPCPLEDE